MERSTNSLLFSLFSCGLLSMCVAETSSSDIISDNSPQITCDATRSPSDRLWGNYPGAYLDAQPDGEANFLRSVEGEFFPLPASAWLKLPIAQDAHRMGLRRLFNGQDHRMTVQYESYNWSLVSYDSSYSCASPHPQVRDKCIQAMNQNATACMRDLAPECPESARDTGSACLPQWDQYLECLSAFPNIDRSEVPVVAELDPCTWSYSREPHAVIVHEPPFFVTKLRVNYYTTW